jgi:hypothetical protein
MEPLPADKPTGPAFAGVVAAALAIATLGLVATLAEVFDGFGDWLSFTSGSGMISGEVILAAAVYFLSWAVLAFFWRRSNPPLPLVVGISALLAIAGVLGTFPLFFRMFGLEE